MSTTAAWCMVQDVLRDAPKHDARDKWLEEKMVEQADVVVSLREEVGKWANVRPDAESPSELEDAIEELENDKETAESERDEARTESTSSSPLSGTSPRATCPGRWWSSRRTSRRASMRRGRGSRRPSPPSPSSSGTSGRGGATGGSRSRRSE